jgi:antitoxin component YwqK of YwqJK toxin-antitoxin module
MERFWYPNGKLKEESHWFDGQPDGIMQTWNQEGEVQRIVRFKRGELIEVLKE